MNKAHILREIKRTAEANGGEPLGQSRFEKETGVKKSDWYGKFWARWGDALREAGFIANQLRGAIDQNELLEKYAKYVIELGRIPAGGDLRLKTRSDSQFPSHTVYENRFGTKLELIKQLVDYCRIRKEYGAVVGLCEGYVASDQSMTKESEPQNGDIGFVYLIKSGRFHKIGRANSAGRREYELAIQLPEKASTVHVIRTDDPSGIEAYWHNRFGSKRKNGEWFDLAAADIAAFKRRKFM
jgi:Meiotically up-regulated gene 113